MLLPWRVIPTSPLHKLQNVDCITFPSCTPNASESPCPHRDLQDHPIDPSANVAAPIRDGSEWPWLEKLFLLEISHHQYIHHFSFHPTSKKPQEFPKKLLLLLPDARQNPGSDNGFFQGTTKPQDVRSAIGEMDGHEFFWGADICCRSVLLRTMVWTWLFFGLCDLLNTEKDKQKNWEMNIQMTCNDSGCSTTFTRCRAEPLAMPLNASSLKIWITNSRVMNTHS